MHALTPGDVIDNEHLTHMRRQRICQMQRSLLLVKSVQVCDVPNLLFPHSTNQFHEVAALSVNAAGTPQRIPPFLGPCQGLRTSFPRVHLPTCGRHVGGHDPERSAQLQKPPFGCDTSKPTTKGTCILLRCQRTRRHVLDRHGLLLLPALAFTRPKIATNDEVARAA